MSTKHTPTPWKLEKSRFHFHIDDANGTRIADIRFCQRPDGSTTEIEAAHIVRCVNSHEALLAALKALIAESPNQTVAGDAARAAIAAAESN